MQALHRICFVFAALSFSLVVILAACPVLLRSHEYKLRCVRAKFNTPAEQFALAADAAKRGVPVFGALYDPKMNQMISAYVPMRASFTHFLLLAINFGEPLATKEDFLPAPPAPMAFEFIDELKATPFTVDDFRARRTEWLMTFVASGILFGVAAWHTHRGERNRADHSVAMG